MWHEVVPDFKYRRVFSFLRPERLVSSINRKHGIVKARIKFYLAKLISSFAGPLCTK